MSISDVTIIDNNNIWVVGDILTDSGSFEIAHWIDNNWVFHDLLTSGKIDGVFSFSENDVWFASGCRIYHWDGIEYQYLYECDWQSGGINLVSNIWGNIYWSI